MGFNFSSISSINKSRENYIGDSTENDGKMNGYGIMFFKSNEEKLKYNGKWENNKMNGYGIMDYIDHSIYTGEWKNDIRHGYGTYKDKMVQNMKVIGKMTSKKELEL